MGGKRLDFTTMARHALAVVITSCNRPDIVPSGNAVNTSL
jgi:hypothetical protein